MPVFEFVARQKFAFEIYEVFIIHPLFLRFFTTMLSKLSEYILQISPKYADPLSVLILLIHYIDLRFLFFLMVFDICGDAVSEVGGFVVVIEVDRIVAEVAYKVCGAAA